MDQEKYTVMSRDSTQSELGHLIITLRHTDGDVARIIVGRPGMPNVVKDLRLGNAVLFETPDEGTFEVRVLTLTSNYAIVLVTRVSPHLGILAGLTDIDPNNLPFASIEIEQIASSIDNIKRKILHMDIEPEKLDLISRKLDEIQEASHRLGRKDWINYVIGALTSSMMTAALNSEAASAIFKIANENLSWLFHQALQLLQ
jgi:hypothetical protein